MINIIQKCLGLMQRDLQNFFKKLFTILKSIKNKKKFKILSLYKINGCEIFKTKF
jgi:hypothetical protein